MKDSFKENLFYVTNNEERPIPGLNKVEDREFWYIECTEERLKKIFRDLVRKIDPAIPKFGGVITEGCELTTPNGRIFQALSYKGDLEGWRKQIELGAKALGIATGKMESEIFSITNSMQFDLFKCNVRFY